MVKKNSKRADVGLNRLVIFGVIFMSIIITISLVSAVWYLPWTWFNDPENNTQQEGQLFQIIGGSQWNVLKATGEESNTQIIFTNQKDKKTEICVKSDIDKPK